MGEENSNTRMYFGAYAIAQGEDPSKVLIWHSSGEGGEFSAAKFAEAIHKFFVENF